MHGLCLIYLVIVTILQRNAREKELSKMRSDFQSQSKKKEEEECSFQPKLKTYKHSTKSREAETKNVFDALYVQATSSLDKKQQLIEQYHNVTTKPSFHPTISNKSSKLAENKRKKRILELQQLIFLKLRKVS
jgi:hypothetical protein